MQNLYPIKICVYVNDQFLLALNDHFIMRTAHTGVTGIRYFHIDPDISGITIVSRDETVQGCSRGTKMVSIKCCDDTSAAKRASVKRVGREACAKKMGIIRTVNFINSIKHPHNATDNEPPATCRRTDLSKDYRRALYHVFITGKNYTLKTSLLLFYTRYIKV